MTGVIKIYVLLDCSETGPLGRFQRQNCPRFPPLPIARTRPPPRGPGCPPPDLRPPMPNCPPPWRRPYTGVGLPPCMRRKPRPKALSSGPKAASLEHGPASLPVMGPCPRGPLPSLPGIIFPPVNRLRTRLIRQQDAVGGGLSKIKFFPETAVENETFQMPLDDFHLPGSIAHDACDNRA